MYLRLLVFLIAEIRRPNVSSCEDKTTQHAFFQLMCCFICMKSTTKRNTEFKAWCGKQSSSYFPFCSAITSVFDGFYRQTLSPPRNVHTKSKHQNTGRGQRLCRHSHHQVHILFFRKMLLTGSLNTQLIQFDFNM